MGFLSADTMKALEGKYLKFSPNVKRTFKLLKHTLQAADPTQGRKYDNHQIEVMDMETGETKEFNADFGFMAALQRINNELDFGDVIEVLPLPSGKFSKTGTEYLKYEINKQNKGIA